LVARPIYAFAQERAGNSRNCGINIVLYMSAITCIESQAKINAKKSPLGNECNKEKASYLLSMQKSDWRVNLVESETYRKNSCISGAYKAHKRFSLFKLSLNSLFFVSQAC
jgi:hypothetical protein